MQTTSGLVLDIYDDFQGDVLRSIYPTQEDLPGTVKTASVLSSELRASLPDDAFALVLRNGEQVLRKYACTDEGNTTLSVQYFLKNAHKLPVEAQKTAAANLVMACGWYDIEVPSELEKVAVGIDTALNALSMGSETYQGAKSMGQGLSNARALNGQMNAGVMLKKADLSGTATMPNQAPVGKQTTPLANVQKSASIGHLVKNHPKSENHQNFGPEEGVKDDYTHGTTPDRMPQAKAMTPHVDVSNKEPPKVIKNKEASAYALPGEKKYPLDSYAQVKEASAYFDQFWGQFEPATRHEYCVNTVKQAAAMDIPVSEMMARYGSETYADEDHLKVAYEMRWQTVQQQPEAVALLKGLFEKRAEIEPELFAATLAEFDKVAGIDFRWDEALLDPFYSTFGMTEKQAEWSEVIGNDMVTESQLRSLALKSPHVLRHHFKEDFQSEFRKDPVGIFSSMPILQKKIIMRIANENSPGYELTG